jgi:methylamine utilization protein MauE
VEQILLGLTLGLAAVLATAAMTKARNLQAFEATLVSLTPGIVWRWGLDSRLVARAVVSIEALLAALLVLRRPSTQLVAFAAVVLFTGFLVGVSAVRRRRIPCSCFGGTTQTGRIEVARTVALAAIAAALGMATALGGAPATIGELALPGLALAVAVFSAALLPEAAKALSRRAAPHDRGTARAERAQGGMTRRAALKAAFAGTVAAVLSGALPAFASANPPRPCGAQFDLCYGCTTKITFENDIDCCVACYSACQGVGTPCTPGVSCGGCWPGQ